ncbi:MAG: glycosyltransferase family 4 protein [Lentisphaerae bacterium]|nr:glycosyltransferase family 4 protein [Lentisphaerota bacterium]
MNHTARISGAEKSLLEMLSALQLSPYDPIVGLPPAEEGLAAILKQRGVQVVHFKMRRIRKTCNPFRLIGYLLNIITTVFELRTFIRNESIACVHSNSNTAHLYGGPAAKLAGIPAVWHCRDLTNLGIAGRFMYNLSSRVVAISSCVQQHVQKYAGDTSKICTIYNCIDSDMFAPSAQTASRTNSDPFLVLMIAQLVPWKNHRLFLDAAASIARNANKIRFDIVGDDIFDDQQPYVKELRKLIAEKNLSELVTFTGYRSDVPALLASADLLVHPAVQEPFGRVILEAMAAGLPVIALNSCGPAEIIRNGVDGILVEPDVELLAAAILNAMRNRSQMHEMARSASIRVRQIFNLAVFAKKMTAVYEEIL